MRKRAWNFLGLFFAALLACGCAAHNAPIPPGTVPAEHDVSASDEEYGHEVLGELSRKYPLDRVDAHVYRVRDVVDRLTTKGLGSKNPWHVYVFDSSSFKNAAATRGNCIFVWSGLLDTLKNDDELATVLAHEIGHLLAGHTNKDPNAETKDILTGGIGDVASSIISATGVSGIIGSLAGEVISLALQAMITNPGERSKELEADLIGMFLMAQAGIDPAHAVDFWKRVRLDPDFANGTFTFLSGHPSSDDRLEQLEKFLPQAQVVYQDVKAREAAAHKPDPSHGFALKPAAAHKSKSKTDQAKTTWIVEEDEAPVFVSPAENVLKVTTLKRGRHVTVIDDQKYWLHIDAPAQGYMRGSDLAPLRDSPTPTPHAG